MRLNAEKYLSNDAVYRRYTYILTRALIGLFIFHHLIGGGGGGVENPSYNFTPRRRSEKPKSAFGSPSESITKLFQSIVR